MANSIEEITLGSGILYLNNVAVGYLKGDVSLQITTNKLRFKPANQLNAVKVFRTSEEVTLKASLAQLALSLLKYAIGSTTAVSTSNTSLSYDPSSFSFSSGTYDGLTFGGQVCEDTTSLRFEHTRPCGDKFVVILYSVASISDMIAGFKEEEVTLNDIEFLGLAIESRPAGDRVGVMLNQTD